MLKRPQAYYEYIDSAEWQRVRERRIELGKRHCAVCTTCDGLQVHHLTYERFGHENMNDLLPLCAFHHDVVEELKKSDKLPTSGSVIHLLVETIREILKWELEHQREMKLCAERRIVRLQREVERSEKIFANGKGFSPARRKWNA